MTLEKKLFYETLFKEREEELIEIIRTYDSGRIKLCLDFSSNEVAKLILISDKVLISFNILNQDREAEHEGKSQICELFYDYLKGLKGRL